MEAGLDATVLDHLPAAVLVVDRDGRILRVNEAAERFCPWPAGGAVGRSLFDMLGEYRGGQDLERAVRDAMEAAEPGSGGFETILGHVDGEVVVRARWLVSGGQRYGVMMMLRVGASRSTDSRTTADLAQRIADVKHQINNPLMGILGHAELLMIDGGMPAEARNRAEVIQGEARRIRDQMELLDRLRRNLSS